MNKDELERIIAALTKECEKNFESYKMDGYTIAELTVIPFGYEEISTRKVSDWGTDEDRDEYIWYSREGWQRADMTVQVGAGISKIVDSRITTITHRQVVETLLSWSLLERVKFIHTAYEMLKNSEFKRDLY